MATTSTTTAGFTLGISAEDKLSMPLDDLIKKSKAVSKANKPKTTANANAKPAAAAGNAGKKKAGEKTKKPAAAPTNAPAASKKKAKKPTRQQTNVKKTVTVPVSKAARARATTKASSTKRQEVINKRRPGLVIAKPTQTKREVPVQVRRQKTSMLRVARKAAPVTAVGKKRQQTQQKKQNSTGATLDVSNIQRHFASHPSKFDLPKGTNLRITINLNKVKPVVGAKKNLPVMMCVAHAVCTSAKINGVTLHSTRSCAILNEPRSMSISSSVSDISSLDEVESEISYDDEAKISPTPRRHSHEALTFTPQARASLSVPSRVSTPLHAPSIRSSVPPSMPILRRPVTAPAPGTVVPESSDRLKHLKIHMKQLQKLYNEEVHLEQLAARDAFLQTMCTSSITLFRHCASRSRFFTAVKALMCQYLPASNAKLIQVERSGSSTSKYFLVLQDNQTFEVTESDSIGIAGNAAHAMIMSLNGGGRISPDLSRSSSPDGSSSASVARTSDELTSSSVWLESHSDCILPSTNGHLLLLFPLHSLYRLGFDQEIDLAARKKDADGAQLLVMGLKNSKGHPIGIVEAILPDGSQCSVEFLDAFGILLATALESRVAICRSVVDKLSVRIVDNGHESRHGYQAQAETDDAVSDLEPTLTVPLVENCGRIDLFGGAAVIPEQDEVLLQAFHKPVTRICKENRDLRQQARDFEHSLVRLGQVWGNLSADSFETNLGRSGCGQWKPVRAYFGDFMDRFVAGNRSNDAKDSISSAQIRLLFRGETKDAYKQAYGSAGENELDDSGTSLFPGTDGQFTILQQVMNSNEAFESGEAMLVLPIRVEGMQRRQGETEGTTRPPSQVNAAMIMILPNASNSDVTKSSFSTMMKLHVAPLLVQFVEHFLFKLMQIDHVHELQQRLETMSEQEVALTTQITDGVILKGITHQYLMCSSLEEFVIYVNSLATSNEDVKSKVAKVTLFIASYSEAKEMTSRKPLTSVWTMAENVNPGICEKIELVGEQNADELHGSGIPSYVLFTQEPLSYTSSHHAFAPSRQNQQFLLSRFEHDYFYAAPLSSSTSVPVGVLEFAFESESQRERFLGDPLLLRVMTEVTSQFISLHQQFIGQEDSIRQDVEDAKDLHSQVLQRWVSFVAKWLSLPLEDFDTWKHDASVLLLELLPSRGYFVNLLCSIQNQTDEENAAVQTIISDTNHQPHSSNTLNVLNQAILPTCMGFPLKRGYASDGISTVYGVLAFSKKDDKPFTSEEKQLGSMASYLLSNQVMLFKQKDEFESAIMNYDEQLATQSNTIARANANNKDLLRDLHEKQSLIKLSSIRYEELVPSMSIEQLCEKAAQSISRSGGTTSESLDQASLEKESTPMSVLVLDASQESFTFVGNGCQRGSIRVDQKESEATDEPWFSGQRISTHTAPFVMVPPKLVKTLASCRSNKQMDSITIVPVRGSDESGKQVLFGLIVVANVKESTDDYLFDVAESFSKVFRLKHEYDNWNARQQHLEGTVSALRAEQQASNLWNELFGLAHELGSEILDALSSLGDIEACKRHLKSRLIESLTRILHGHVELTKVELTLGKNRSELKSPIYAADSTFTRELVVSGKDEVFLGMISVEWKPEDTKLPQGKVLVLFEWISGFLQSILHHCVVFDEIQARANDIATQCQFLKVQADKDSDTIDWIRKEEHRWHLVRQISNICVSIEQSGSEGESDILDAESHWCRLFAAIHSFINPQLKLWLKDEINTNLWTIVDGKKETKASPVRKDNVPAGAAGFSSIDLVYNQGSQGAKPTPRVVLGILEVSTTDLPRNYDQNPSTDEMVIQQLVIVLSNTLRLLKQSSVMHHLEDNVQQLELKAATSTAEWRHHVTARFKQLLTIQTRINKFVSSKLSFKPGSNELELWFRELLGVVENSLQFKVKASSSGEPAFNAPNVIRLRSLLLFEGASGDTECGTPPLLHSSNKDCSMCSTSKTLSKIQELELVMEEKGGESCLVLDLRGAENSSRTTKHPALELLLSECQIDENKREYQYVWEIDELHNAIDPATHQLVVKTIRRTISDGKTVRVVLVGLVEKSVEIDDSSSLHTLNFYGEAILDAVQKIIHAVSLHEQQNNLSGKFLRAERALSESRQKQRVVERTMEDIGSVLQSAVDSEHSDSGLMVLLGKFFQTIMSIPVKVHLCARLEIPDLADEWRAIGSKHDTKATQEMLQWAKAVTAEISGQGSNISRDTIESMRDDNDGRFLYPLFDAKNVIIGTLVLDGTANPLAQVQSEFTGAIKTVLQVAAAKVGIQRSQYKHDAQVQKMSQERDQLLLEKCQLELNSLEMKNLLHNNEANLLRLRSHYEQVVHPTNKSVRTFLYELKDLKSPNDVLLQLGHAITSLKDVTGVQFNALHKNPQNGPPTLFSSVVKDEDKSTLRSADVQEAIGKCVKQAEMIKVCTKNRSNEMQSEEARKSTQSGKCAMLYLMTIPQDLQRTRNKAEYEIGDAAESLPTTDVVVIVLADVPSSTNSAPFPVEGNSMTYQLKQVELLLHLATMRCHTLVQREIWEQQFNLLVEKESNTEDQINLMSLKCNQWQEKHDFQTQLQRGLAHQLALGLPSLYSGAAKAVSSKQMLEMWQALSGILCNRLEAAFQSRRTVSQSSMQLYGAVQDGNFFFTFGKSVAEKRRLQLISFQQCVKNPTHQAIWKAFVSEAIAEHKWRDGKGGNHEAASESMKTVFPMMSITSEEEDQGHEKIVGALEFLSEQPLDEGEKEAVQEFLSWFSPAVYCVGRAVHRKVMKKHAPRHTGVSTIANSRPPSMENVYSANLGIAPPSVGLASAALFSDHRSHETKTRFTLDANDVSARSPLESEVLSNFGAGDEGDGDSEDEAKAMRMKREKLLRGIASLLLKLQEANDLRALAKILRQEVKRLWACHTKRNRQSVHDCQLICSEDIDAEHQARASSNNDDVEIAPWISELMKLGHKTRSTSELEVLKGVDPSAPSQSGEQFRLICLPEISGQTVCYCLVIIGSHLDEVFDADDERIYLPQIARSVRRQLSQLCRMTKLQEEASELQAITQQGTTLVAKTNQLERNVVDMAGFLEFQSALSGAESERVLSSLATDYLKKLLRCERAVFQVMLSGSRAGVEPSHPFADARTEEGDPAEFATSTLEMDNLLRLRVFSPHASGGELLAICTARMGTRSQQLDIHKQELLKRVSPIIGSAMHRIRVQERLSHQVRANDNAQSEIDRLNRENKELHSQLQQQSHSREDFSIRLGDQQTLVAENKRLEAQLSKMVARLDAFAHEREEQQFELAAREKANAKLTFQLDQFAKVEAQIQHVEDENSALRHREKKLEKKILKQRLQLQQLMSEVGHFKQKEDFDRHEIAQLQRQVTVLNEKQRHASGTTTTKESLLRSQSSRYFHHMQHQVQKRKQINLAKELRQLTAMEVREMKARNREQRAKRQQNHIQTQEADVQLKPPQMKSHLS